MIRFHSDKIQRSGPKWLFAILLMLSFFISSGLAIQSPVKTAGIATTLLQSHPKMVAQSISYNRAVRLNQKGVHAFNFLITFPKALINLHTCKVKVQLIHLNNSANTIAAQTYFPGFHNITHQNTGDQHPLA
ncbi:hypothetical protein [Mucilaginibacter xinganensis]|nr:hypothetical protein [Mucilaginibacter xinganensis]